MREKLFEAFQAHPIICTDTRKIEEGSIFFALKGENFDGNQYAHKALEAGCALAVVDDHNLPSNPKLLVAADVLTSLQELAEDYRNSFDIPFIAITGSNGKTTTKELMHAVLSKQYRVHATAGNFNNHIGVPLTLLSMPQDTEIAIIEMGANHVGEIANLCTIAHPGYGLITNIGKAHLEGFGGVEGIIKGKGELYDYLREEEGLVFRNTDADHLGTMAEGMNQILYSANGGELNITLVQEDPTVSFDSDLGPTVHTQLTGRYNMHNFATAISIGQYFDVPDEEICHALAEYSPSNKRSQIEKTERNTVILDAYNANPTSMMLALDNLAVMEAESKFFVMGDMMELGADSHAEHQSIVTQALSHGLQGILVGPEFGSVDQKGFEHFTTNSAAAKHLAQLNLSDHLVLVKGSRGIKLEEVMPSL